MPVITDISLVRYEDGLLTIGLVPPTNINGWPLKFSLMPRFGGTPFYNGWSTSGLDGVSGINITNTTQGVMQINIPAYAQSGREYGNLSYSLERMGSGLSSGKATILAEGFLALLP